MINIDDVESSKYIHSVFILKKRLGGMESTKTTISDLCTEFIRITNNK
jgi:hypothetical protein